MPDTLKLPKISIENGDCFSLMPGLPDGQIDCVITDPPYNITDLAFEVAIDWQKWWAEIERITKPNAAIVMFSCQPFTTDLINSRRQFFRYDLIWKKSCPVGYLDANRRPLRVHEVILVFSRAGKGAFTYNPVMRKGKLHKRGDHAAAYYGKQKDISGTVPKSTSDEYYPTSVLEYSNGNYHSPHPTAKPVDLLRWLIKTYSNPDELVFDPFMGSGSTGEACLLEGRNFLGYELDKSYFDVAEKRIAEIERILKKQPKHLCGNSSIDGLPLFEQGGG